MIYLLLFDSLLVSFLERFMVLRVEIVLNMIFKKLVFFDINKRKIVIYVIFMEIIVSVSVLLIVLFEIVLLKSCGVVFCWI